jgi:hypothetical protein
MAGVLAGSNGAGDGGGGRAVRRQGLQGLTRHVALSATMSAAPIPQAIPIHDSGRTRA